MCEARNKSKLIVYSGFNPTYYSYYLFGLTQFLNISENKINYSKKEFPEGLKRYFSFFYNNKKIVIDAMDEPNIKESVLGWCDLYGKTNYSTKYLSKEEIAKILPIGPSFGIKFWSLIPACVRALKNYLITSPKKKDTREFFANYYRQAVYRVKESNYHYFEPDENYIFFVSTIWKNEENTNNYRKNFIKTCRNLKNIKFEGGFISRPDVQKFEEYSISSRYLIHDYIQKTKRSLLVFNTPAVGDCHGWKLAEYFALGKAIISTPLSREMPAQLVHGKHLHFVDGSEDSIKDAIQEISNNKSYQESLQKNAREYYQKYLQPKAVISRLINISNI